MSQAQQLGLLGIQALEGGLYLRNHNGFCCCPTRSFRTHRPEVICGRPLRARALMSADAGWPIAVICPARRCGVEAAGLDAVRGSAPNQSFAQ